MKRRICIFCESWESGGIESFLNTVLTHLDLSKMEIDLVTSQRRESVFTGPLEKLGVRFVELSGRQRDLPANHRRFRSLLAERSYDVVHLNVFQGMSLYYAELARRAGVPVRIAHSHNTALRKSLTRPVKQLLHRLFCCRYTASATELWACSPMAAEFLFPREELERRGYCFLPNGIDVERFRFRPEERARVREELGLEDRFVIGSVGRLCYQKNQTFLLEAFAETAKSRPEATLLLVGEGPDRPKLEKRAEALGLADRVLFYGTSDRVEELFWAMDAFAFPSLFEGFGIVAIEAQAAGVSVLCSDRVPAEVRVTDRIRALPLEVQGWAGAMAALLPPTEREGAADQVRRAGFDAASVAREIEKRYLG